MIFESNICYNLHSTTLCIYFIFTGKILQYCIVIWRLVKTHETPCSDNWLLLLISFTNIFALLVTLSTLLDSVNNLNLVYVIHIYNALKNSLENATGGVLQKIINKNVDPVKLELYSLQLYWKLTLTPAFFQDKMQLSMLVRYIC